MLNGQVAQPEFGQSPMAGQGAAMASFAIVSLCVALSSPFSVLRIGLLGVFTIVLLLKYLPRLRISSSVGVLLATSVASVPLSVEFGRSVVQLATLVLILAAAKIVVDVLDMRQLLNGLLAGLGCVVGIGLVARIGGFEVGDYRGFHGLTANPNIMGYVLSVFAVLLACKLKSPLLSVRNLSILGGLGLIFGLLSETLSDNALNYAVIGIFVVGVLRVLRRVRGSVMAAGLIMLLGVTVLAHRPILHYAEALTGVSANSNLSGRLEIWPIAVLAIGERPIFGWGLGSTTSATAQFGDSQITRTWDRLDLASFQPHNGYLDTGVQLGLIGVGVLLIMILTGVRNAWNSFRAGNGEEVWVMGLLLTVIAYNFTESRFLDPALALFLVAVILFAAAKDQSRDAARRTQNEVSGPRSSSSDRPIEELL